ncbi:histidine phosphatase family protein [Sphingobacterium multivorum]|uniref:histidine phosphatase family protein n=1 Tax=Sphingobacterium multivorum TaxID=28454 RepID=UPI00351AAA81
MKKTFYFIRHGQTDLNLRGIVQGRGVNSPLNKMGIAQAQAFFDHYSTVPFDKIYTSTLLRTHQTVQGFIDLDLPWEQLVGLDEISWGVYEGKEQTPELLAGFEKLVAAWRNGELDVSIENGESPHELMARQQVALDHMLAQTDEKKHISLYARSCFTDYALSNDWCRCPLYG